MTTGWVFFSFYPITVFPVLEGKSQETIEFQVSC